MKRDVAEKIIRAVKEMDQIFGQLDAASNQIHDEEEKKKLRKAIATLVFDVHEKIALEIVKQFSDLHPDKLGAGEFSRLSAGSKG
jgi:hypothetical protein